ncbi:hypothetical protein WJX74_006259 [Apatococcus lobatus]|uniref:Phosphate acetyltransferase n=1 Tax=Apatococcus lobatus TaxID=904363 RepID=A0AAW1RPE1_9CHLO
MLSLRPGRKLFGTAGRRFEVTKLFSEKATLQGSTDAIYITNVDGRRNNSPILLGLIDYLERTSASNVGFFQPVAESPYPHSTTGLPRHVELLHEALKLRREPKDMSAMTAQEAIKLLAVGNWNELLDRVITSYQDYKRGHDLVILEGITTGGAGLVNTMELNARIASSIGTPVMMALDARNDSTAESLVNSALIARQGLIRNQAKVMGIILNKLPHGDPAGLEADIRAGLKDVGLPVFGALPMDPLLSSVRLDEIKAVLGATLAYGPQNAALDSAASEVIVATGTVNELLSQLAACRGPCLVVTSQDRTDVLLAVAAMRLLGSPLPISGMLLTSAGSPRPEAAEAALRACYGGLEGSNHLPLPILSVDMPAYDALQAMSRASAAILPSSHAKIEHAKLLFERHVDAEALATELAAPQDQRLTPKMFMHQIMQQCLEKPQNIVLPEGMDKRVLAAAAEIAAKKLAKITILGKPDQISTEARRLGLDLSSCSIIDHTASPDLEKYVDALVEARKHKGLKPDQARDALGDPNTFGVMMVQTGDSDGMVSGAAHTTAATIRPALQVLRGPESPLVSSVFLMCLPHKVLVYGDCAVNVSPAADQLAQIAVTSADTARAFGLEPRVAMLSYSTGTSGSGPEVERVAEAVKIAKGMRPDLMLEGPIQYDAAVDPTIAAAKIKAPSDVAGQANVCIFPDLNTGNNTYKAVQQSTGAIAMGPIMQGFVKPVNDLSRGCTINDIINTVACTSMQSLGVKGER